MKSDTRNVKLGVCRVYFDGDDLGLTQGGVEVNVTSETHKVEVDQMGKTPINEYVMGRSLTVKVPMAETTVENLIKIMPGATLTQTGGTKASGTVTITTNPSDGETIIINGVTITFKTAVANNQTQVLIGASSAATATNLSNFINATSNPLLSLVDASPSTNVVTLTYEFVGVEGNTFTTVTGTAAAKVTMGGATLTGGVDATKKYVSVDHGIGQDLLTSAKELRLHPTAKAAGDLSDDFVIPLANTGGALNFAYKLDQERIFNVEFTGYPDPTTGRLFIVGDNS
jgi:hypothetical protein